MKKYSFGNVLDTKAVTVKVEKTEGEMPYFTVSQDNHSLKYTLGKDARVYGLGEQVRGINKRGWIYVSNNSDNPHHREDAHSLYGSHNFLLVTGGRDKFGIFIDTPGRVTWDVGYSDMDELVITVEDDAYDIYFIEGKSERHIVQQFRTLIGRSYIAPRWALGYGQSRWSYMNEDEICEVVDRHHENGLPLDSVYMDIDYMNEYEDFTINSESFPDFKDFVSKMKKKNIHLIPIIDAGVKKKDGYFVYEEGKEKGYFCKKEDGSLFVAAVWPGESVFPDMLNEDAAKWFGEKYKILLDMGIDGFWNDMNEPALFYTPQKVEEALNYAISLKGKKLDLSTWWAFGDKIQGLSNNEEDYKLFYHQIGDKKVRHDKVHNLFGYNMTKAATDAFNKFKPEERTLMFSRSSYIGAHRYGGIWQGDNFAWWSHIKLNMCETISLNMCGFVFTGADIGGFGCDTTQDLLLRWLEFGIFTPLFRNHAALGTRRQEAYQFKEKTGFRHVLGMRYKLLPYIYSEYMKAVLKDDLMFAPLAFDYPEDCYAVDIQDQAMIGKEVMIAPVMEQNAKGRYVYVPERMKLFNFHENGEVETHIYEKGHHYIDIALTDVTFFIKEGCAIPVSMAKALSTNDVNFENPEMIGFADNEAEYEYYHDDGISTKYDLAKNITILKYKEN